VIGGIYRLISLSILQFLHFGSVELGSFSGKAPIMQGVIKVKIFDAGFSLIGGLPVLTVFHTWTDKG
jgi:hypothetical protein